MGKVLREAIDSRRDELIGKLLDLEHYKLEEKHLYELTITELEYIYFKQQTAVHPHSGHDSIVWKNFGVK